MFQFFRANHILTFVTIVGAGGLASRILGLVRDRLLATYLGAGRELDIYYAAFRIPDFMYALLILGAISAAFIPIYASLHTKEEQNAFLSNALNVVTLAISALSFLLFLFTPLLIRLIAPGFSPADQELTVFLTRIMLLQPIILAISNIITSVLQSERKFLVTALAPSLYNVGIIVGIIIAIPNPVAARLGVEQFFGIQGLAYGVLLGALLHLVIQLPSFFRLGLSWQPRFGLSSEVKHMLSLMGPRVLGITSDQINLVVIMAIASTLAAGSITLFTWAQNIQAAPMGIIGIAVATVAFPSLSRMFSQHAQEEFVHTFINSFKLILFFSLPLSILFIMLRAQIVRVVLGAGEFGWDETRLTAAALGVFGASLFAQSLSPLLTRAFYSMHNTKTPLFVSVAGFVINIVLAFLFISLLKQGHPFSAFLSQLLRLEGIGDIRVIGLPLAFSLSAITQFIVLFTLLFLTIDSSHIAQLNRAWLKMVVGSVLMGIATYISLRPLALLVDTTTGLGIFLQGFFAGIIGSIVYFCVMSILKENPLQTKTDHHNS